MVKPPDPEPAPQETADELGIDVDALSRSAVYLRTGADGQVLIFLGPERVVATAVPDRFRDDHGGVLLALLAEWLGLPAEVIESLPDSDTDLAPDEETIEFVSFLGAYDQFGDSSDPSSTAPSPAPTPVAGVEVTSPVRTGHDSDSDFRRPAVGDTDAWPDDVDGWRDAIRRLQKQNRTLRASDVRVFYGGLDDAVLEYGEHGSVDEEGRPVGDFTPSGDSWDPETDPLDPALEEALRLEGVRGALPPPDEGLTTAAPPPAGASDDGVDVVDVAFDNTTAIVDDSNPPHRWWAWVTAMTWRWVVAGFAVVGLIVLAFFLFGSSDSDPSDDPADTGSEEQAAAGTPDDSPDAVVRQVLDELLANPVVAVDQTFTIVNPSGRSEVVSEGVIDMEAGETQLTFDASSALGQPAGTTEVDAIVTDDDYFFQSDAIAPVPGRADPGELNDNEAVAQAGLGFLGLGEALSPYAILELANAAEDLEPIEGVEDAYAGNIVLPLVNDRRRLVDNWATATFGRTQDKLPGLVLRTELRVTPDGIEVDVVADLEEAIPLLGDDPEAESLRGVELVNESFFQEATSSGATRIERIPALPLGEYLVRVTPTISGG